MKNRRTLSFFVVLIFIFSIRSTSTVASVGDTPANATIAILDVIYSGTMDQYNDLDFYNFTGSIHRTYNFTFWQTDGNYLPMNLYDSDFNLLESHFAAPYNNRNIVWDGEEKYIIGVYSSEFASYPANFNFTITEVIGESGKTVSSSEAVSEGSVSNTFTGSLDEYWYNFVAIVDHEYSITMSLSPGNYSAFYIYDANLLGIENKYDDSGLHSFNVTGESLYILRAVADFEFMVFPNEFTITIVDLTAASTTSTTTSTTSTTGTSDTSLSTETSDTLDTSETNQDTLSTTAESSSPSDLLSLNASLFVFCIFAIPGIAYLRKISHRV